MANTTGPTDTPTCLTSHVHGGAGGGGVGNTWADWTYTYNPSTAPKGYTVTGWINEANFGCTSTNTTTTAVPFLNGGTCYWRTNVFCSEYVCGGPVPSTASQLLVFLASSEGSVSFAHSPLGPQLFEYGQYLLDGRDEYYTVSQGILELAPIAKISWDEDYVHSTAGGDPMGRFSDRFNVGSCSNGNQYDWNAIAGSNKITGDSGWHDDGTILMKTKSDQSYDAAFYTLQILAYR